MLRTIELILGLTPLSKYDAAAIPMWQMFSSTPDAAPYGALPATVPAALNSSKSFGATASSHMDFALPDLAPMDSLNHILWHAIKGANVPYPQAHGATIGLRVPSSYVWGSMARRVDPLERVTGVPMPKIVWIRQVCARPYEGRCTE
jgi:hypothetical protein